jgi:putative MATE family efflux protein
MMGGRRDLTTGPIGKTLFFFSLPLLGTNVLQSLNASINAIWVSHVLGEAALTATSNANIILMFLLGAVFGVSMAANLLIAQSVGAGDLDMAKRVVGASLIFFSLLAGGVGTIGYFFTPHILDAMHTPAAARIQAIAYLRVIFVAMPFMYFFAYIQMAQRGAGDSRTPFLFSLMAVGLDIILNPLLIMGLMGLPRLGIAGSATATLTAQSISLLLLIVHLYRKRSFLVLRPEEFRYLRLNPTILKSLLLRGLPMGFQMFVISGSAIVMMSLVNGYGVATSAAYGAASQLWTYVQMPAMAIAASVSSMAAQNVGARRWDRVNQIAREGIRIGLMMTAGPVALIYLLNGPILHLFLPAASPAIAVAKHINVHVLWGFVLFSVTFVLFGVVRATGAVIPPLIILILSMWVVRVPTAAWASQFIGADAIWWSFPAGSMTSAALAALYYRYGGWRKARMLDEPRGQAPDAGLGAPAMVEVEDTAP